MPLDKNNAADKRAGNQQRYPAAFGEFHHRNRNKNESTKHKADRADRQFAFI